MVDYPGHYAAVFFTSGCNFRCGYCHNADLIQQQPGLTWAELEIKCTAFNDQWVDAAVITGGEPTLAHELAQLVDFFRQLGWQVKLDTNGSRPEMVQTLLPHLDYVAMDVKAAPGGYRGLTGFADINRIRKSITLIREKAADYEFRTTVLENVHDEAHMHELGAMIQGAQRYVLQPFLPRETLPDSSLRTARRTPPEYMNRLRDLMKSYAKTISLSG
jgi:pyruvate formate lyase activating enzyme